MGADTIDSGPAGWSVGAGVSAENEQFVLGVRFTQGILAALPAAARELVQHEVDLIFAADVPAAKRRLATTRIPIILAGLRW